MSMLSRYQKSGGFVQLLQLIETCGKQKQENFLSMIEGEDVRWSQAIKEKMLTIEKILKWSDDVLAEVVARLQPLTFATFLHGVKPEDRERMLKTFTHAQKRIVDDLYNSKVPSPSEINSAYLKVLQEVRHMMVHAQLRVEKFAPEMVIAEDIEDKLGKSVGVHFQSSSGASSAGTTTASMAGMASHPVHSHHDHHSSKSSGASSEEVTHLRNQVHMLSSENEHLKTELKVAKEKLAQIKKIA